MITQEKALKHLQAAIQLKTVSHHDRTKIDFTEFDRFIDFMRTTYPNLHKQATLEMVLDYSFIYHLKGETEELPVALMGHYDVVPVKVEGWKQDPFGGEMVDGHIYGRGSLDMKGHVIAMLEALEDLLDEGLVFKRDLYILLGHNEETGVSLPDSGARNTMELLKSRGVRFSCVLDEGGAFLDGKALGVTGQIALIGVGEKGYLDVELSATQNGGHASMPPSRSALFNVFEAAMKLERNKFHADFNPATESMFEALIPHMNQPMRFLFKNRSWFKPIILNALVKTPSTAATVRTTAVMTMADGSKAPNVLAQRASVNLNCRIVPGDSVEEVLARIRNEVGPLITITPHNGNNPTDISPSDNAQFKSIEAAIRTVYPEFVAVAPYLMVAATDSRVYHGMADGVYRIQPFKSMFKDLATIHADNERLEVESFMKGIELFRKIILNTTT